MFPYYGAEPKPPWPHQGSSSNFANSALYHAGFQQKLTLQPGGGLGSPKAGEAVRGPPIANHFAKWRKLWIYVHPASGWYASIAPPMRNNVAIPDILSVRADAVGSYDSTQFATIVWYLAADIQSAERDIASGGLSRRDIRKAIWRILWWTNQDPLLQLHARGGDLLIREQRRVVWTRSRAHQETAICRRRHSIILPKCNRK
jgi:hypothetical protein